MASDARVLKVFLSKGSAYTPEQETFIRAFEEFLFRSDCKPYTIDDNSAAQPILAAREEMQGCDAVIVLAFTRYEIGKGTEFPGSPKGRPIDGVRMPTPWNQLEGGMAYGLELPMLILIEKGLTRQAILSDRTEWFPQVIELTPTTLKEKAFNGIFEDWKRRARKRLLAKEKADGLKVAGLSVGELINGMGLKAALSLIVMLGSMLAAAFSAGYWVAQKLGPLL